jgi:hypothetical protein
VTDPLAALLAPVTWAGRFDTPVHPDRGRARAWAAEELARREYQAEQPGPARMLLDWVIEQLRHLPAPEGVDVRLGVPVAAVTVLALLTYVVRRAGGVHRQATARRGEVFESAGRTADDHRRAAQAAEAAGDLRTAVIERFRAIARALTDRALIEPSPGLTAAELARRAGTRLPGLAAEFAAAARSFDDVRYGDRPATAAAVRVLAELDARAAATTPVPLAAPAPGSRAVHR